MKKLSGILYHEFQDALLSAFPDYDKLEQMVRYQLDENLLSLAGSGTLSTVIFNLIKWAESNGRLDDLIQAAQTANSGNRALLIFEENYKKNRDIDNTKFSINSLGINWAAASLPLRPAFAHAQSHELHWADRKKELQILVEMWETGEQRVAGIIGWGGVGKSTLARRWYDELYKREKPPDGFFWWSFYYQPSLDSFLEAVLLYLSGGNFSPVDTPSSWVRVQQLVKLLSCGRFAIVLDGLEVMQETQSAGDNFGCMQDKAFRNMLELCADQQTLQSVVLVTSRFPLTDLQRFSGHSYLNISLDFFSEEDGAEYLEQRGVRGNLAELRAITKEYGGHALSLSTLAGYLTEYFNGNAKEVKKIPFLSTSEKTRINQILVAYNERLTAEQRTIMSIISACRRPPSEKMLMTVIEFGRDKNELSSTIRPLLDLDIFSIKSLISNLEKRSLIYRERNHLGEWGYNAHLMIREFFAGILAQDLEAKRSLNLALKTYFSNTFSKNTIRSIETMNDVYDCIYYTCQAGFYDEAARIIYGNYVTVDRWEIGYLFGVYEFELSVLREFFEDRDITKTLLVNDEASRAFLITEVGYALYKLGKLAEALDYWNKYIEELVVRIDNKTLAIVNYGIAQALSTMGKLDKAYVFANKGLDSSRVSNQKLWECNLLATLGWLAFLRGERDIAQQHYVDANSIQWSDNPDEVGLFSILGVEYATFLLETGQIEESLRYTEWNLSICQKRQWQESIVHCERLLGDIELSKGNHSRSVHHYEKAIDLARNFGLQEQIALILLGFSKILLSQGNTEAANENLKLALQIAVEFGYQIPEINIRLCLADVFISEKENDSAREQISVTLSISESANYYWGQATALHTLGKIELLSGDPQKARQLLEDACQIQKRIGDPRAESTLSLLNQL